jgi:hypothetical protein
MPHLVDGENFDLVVTRQDDMTRGSADQSPRDGGECEIDPFRGSASSSPTILNASLPSSRLNAIRCPKATALNSAGGGTS